MPGRLPHVPVWLLLCTGWGLCATEARAESSFSLVDVTSEAGIRFRHQNSPTPEKYVVETMGSGCAFLDFDADGHLDIFLVNGGPTPGSAAGPSFDHALYRNRGDGTFREVTSAAGIESNRHYGMGVAVGDYDNDGLDDLFLTHFGGPDILYRNRGNGTFQNVTEAAQVGAGNQWSSSAAFLDLDNDGDLDLYVARYLDHSFQNNKTCGFDAIVTYCAPEAYNGVADSLYRNEGNGTFTDISSRAGIALPAGKGLGVVPLDYNRDGWMDLYVANDAVDNFLLENQGDGTFQELALVTGTALDEHGEPQSGMGTVAGDYDGDGWLDLAVTNLDLQYLALYRNRGNGSFEDASSHAGIQLASRPFVGFGLALLDLDNDADLDFLVANGHILDNASRIRPDAIYRQPKLLLENAGGRFRDVTSGHGQALTLPQVSRGLARGDYDNDGDLDVLVNNCGGNPMLLRNDGGNSKSWIELKLIGTKSNRNGFGALVELTAGSKHLVTQVTSAGSYLSASDYRVHFGLGEHRGPVTATVSWPGGARDVYPGLEPRQQVVLKEGSHPEP